MLAMNQGRTLVDVAGDPTANDGHESITLPESLPSATGARFKVKCSNSVFFNLSGADLIINSIFDHGKPVIVDAGTNGIAEPGETIGLLVPLINRTAETVTQVTGRLSSSRQGIFVFGDRRDYPDIPPSTTRENNRPYQINIPATTVCSAQLPLTLQTNMTRNGTVNRSYQINIPLGTVTMTNAESLDIPDNNQNGLISHITLQGLGVVPHPDINIDLDITHSFRGDLDILLTSPQGTTISLIRHNADDSGSGYSLNIPADLAPAEPLSRFNGENIDGVWTLKITDSLGGDTGTLNRWSIQAKSAACDGSRNIVPVALNGAYTTSATITSKLQASDADGNTLTYQLLTNPGKGTLHLNTETGEFTYTANPGITGTDTLSFKVSDGTAYSNTATVTITIVKYLDTDNDGHEDRVDAFPNDPTEWLDTDGDTIGNNTDPDDDNDGLSDTLEISMGLNPLLIDSDGNGIMDGYEDTDNDGFNNLAEIRAGTDPADGNSKPTPSQMAYPDIVIPNIIMLLLH